MLVRGDRGEWALELVSAPASPQGGRHFVDILGRLRAREWSGRWVQAVLEPSLGSLIRANIPGAPARQKVAFAMEKGEVFGLPETGSLGQVFAGLGWDVASGDEVEVDLDVSAICFSKEHRELGAVFFGNDEDFGLKHSGDNLTGEGDGDDEVISADLAKIPPNVEQIVFVVNIYTNGVTFGQVSNAYCRIFDSSGAELARSERGLIISRLFREPGDRWGFQALGQFCRGKTWKDAVPEVLALAKKPATAFQVRSESTMSLDSIPTGTAASYLGRLKPQRNPG
ncbi:unnamed protein product [Prorocentrum cordatum]|uniref:TerD domain-containing protein n=1 Tax=Prorocentrum cordatum TaxID=2364126 RepID=A0ABN9TE37_9DINO|nr:unnamed protein product [Polarella glacialis]